MASKMANQSLTKKFTLIIILAFVPASLVASVFDYRRQYLAGIELGVEKARSVAQTLSDISDNRYNNNINNIDSWHSDEGKRDFYSRTTQGQERMERLLEKTLSMTIRYVAFPPAGNLNNTADSFEQEGIEILERSKDQRQEYVKVVWFQGKKVIRYLKPLFETAEPYPRCHALDKAGGGVDEAGGRLDEAGGRAATSSLPIPSYHAALPSPQGLRRRVRGAISLIIPIHLQAHTPERGLMRSLWLNLGLGGGMVLIWLLFAKISITDRLENLSEMMAVFSRQEDFEGEGGDEHLPVARFSDSLKENIPLQDIKPQDEIGSLFSAFYLMRASISQKIKCLQKEVDLSRVLTNSAVYGMIALDDKGKILFFNHGAERIFGWKKDDILNQKASLLIPTKLYRDYKRALIQSLRDEPLADEPLETAGLRKSGEEFPAYISVSAGKMGASKVFATIIQDITKQKRKEGEISRQNEKLVLLSQISSELLLERDLKKLAEYSLRKSLELTDSPLGLFLVKDKEGNFGLLASLGISAQAEEAQLFRPVGVLGEIIRQQKPQIINTNPRSLFSSDNSRADRTILSFGRLTLHSFLGVPIIADQEVIGIICTADRPEGYTKREEELVSALAKDLSLLMVRNAVERETQVLKERFQTLFDQAADMIVICNLEGKILAVNYRTVQYTGYSYGELINEAFWKLHLPNEERRVRDFLMRVVEDKAFRIEGYLRQKGGGAFPVDLCANLLTYADQKLIQVVIRDIIKFKNTEADLKERIEWLSRKLDDCRRESAFFRMAMDALPEYGILMDRTGRIILANALFCQRFGYSADELIGQPVEFLFDPALSVDIVDGMISQALRGGWKGKVVHLTKERQGVWLELSLQAVRRSDGDALGLLGIYSECSSGG